MNESQYRLAKNCLGMADVTDEQIESFAEWLDNNNKIVMDDNCNYHWVDDDDADAHYGDWQSQWWSEFCKNMGA